MSTEQQATPSGAPAPDEAGAPAPDGPGAPAPGQPRVPAVRPVEPGSVHVLFGPDATRVVLANGLSLLGVSAPERM